MAPTRVWWNHRGPSYRFNLSELLIPESNVRRATSPPSLLYQGGERDGRVCQAVGVDDGAVANEGLDVVALVPDVGVHGGEHSPVFEPEGEELPDRKSTRLNSS